MSIRTSRRCLFAAAVLSVLTLPAFPGQAPDDFVAAFQKVLESRDLAAYGELFVPGIRASEVSEFRFDLEAAAMDSVLCRKAGERTDDSGVRRIVLQVLFQNSFSAVVEIWQMDLVQESGRWLVSKKIVSGKIRNLYKVRLPVELADRAASVEITHKDIRMTFEDAAVFYDNIPGLDTALCVVGKGRIDFEPSDAGERHQLQLLYGQPALRDGLESVFVRCSDGFFRGKIRIRPAGGKAIRPITPAEKAAASSIFQRSYLRSFTIQNSMTGELLSFLPQGEEAVFDFRGTRAGDLTYIYSPFSEEEVNLVDRDTGRVINLYSAEAAEEPKAKTFFVSLEDRFDVRDYDIELDFRPDKQFLSARARIAVVPQSPTLDGLKFRLSPQLEILRVIDSEKRDLFYTADKLRKYLYIYFTERPKPGEATSVEIIYRGKLAPVPPTMDVIGQYGIGDTRYVYVPQPETFFYSHSSFWYPEPAEDDYFTSRLKVVVPPDYACVSSGELIDKGRLKDMEEVVQIEKMGSAFFTFQTRSPVKYLAFIVGKFDKLEEEADPLPMQSLVSQDVADKRGPLFNEAREIARTFGEWFGPFPFEKLSIVQRLWPEPGGHSPASFIVLNEAPRKGARMMLRGPDSPVDLSRWKEYFLAHEIAHQWWGQGVTWGTYRDLWLSEGMAQFAAVYYLGRRNGETFATILKKLSQWARKKSDAGPITLGSRLSFMDYAAFQAVVYDKAALVLNMLRELVGDEVFFRGLRTFFADHKFGPVRTRQFRAAMEKASGMDLARFFQGWFDAYELPEVKVSWTEEKSENGPVLAVKVRQVGTPFVFPLWIQWESRGAVVREKMIVDAPNGEYRFRLTGRPSRVRVNPESAVPGSIG